MRALKAELRARGASTLGKKSELTQGLEAWDNLQEESHVSQVSMPPSVPVPQWPVNARFQTLTPSARSHVPIRTIIFE